jgi:uncharacterized protein (DUF697 family)
MKVYNLVLTGIDMKDIKLNTGFKKVQYFIAWFGFIVGGVILAWIIALFLASYGKTTNHNVKNKKDLLNKTWQKFVFVYGSIVGDLIIASWIIGTLFA